MTNGYTYSTVTPVPLTKLSKRVHVRKSLFWTACVTVILLFIIMLSAFLFKLSAKNRSDFELNQLKFDVQTMEEEMRVMSHTLKKIAHLLSVSNNNVNESVVKSVTKDIDVVEPDNLNATLKEIETIALSGENGVLLAKAHLKQLVREYNESAEVHSLTAKVYYLLTEMTKLHDDVDQDELLFLFDEGIRHAEIALAIDNSSMSAHEGLLLMQGQKSLQTYLSPFTRLAASKVGRREIEWFRVHHPEYYMATAITAVLQFEAANLSWLERQAALFLEDVPSGTYEEALKGFLEAIKFPLDTYQLKRMYTYICLCYINLSEYEKAYEYIKLSQAMPSTSIMQMVDDRKMAQILEEYGSYFPKKVLVD